MIRNSKSVFQQLYMITYIYFNLEVEIENLNNKILREQKEIPPKALEMPSESSSNTFSLREKCPNKEFFLISFFLYFSCKSPYSVQI